MNTIADAVAALAECVCTALTEFGAGEPCWCGPWHGDTVAWDYCDACDSEACGMAYVRLVSTFAFETFPVAIVDVGCQKPLGYTIEVGSLRCMPTMMDDGSLPPPNEVADSALGVLLDHDAMLYALTCCAPEGFRGWTVAIESYQALGPQGNCGGGAWLAHLTFDP